MPKGTTLSKKLKEAMNVALTSSKIRWVTPYTARETMKPLSNNEKDFPILMQQLREPKLAPWNQQKQNTEILNQLQKINEAMNEWITGWY